jgi:hypothetical protein
MVTAWHEPLACSLSVCMTYGIPILAAILAVRLYWSSGRGNGFSRSLPLKRFSGIGSNFGLLQ